ncbi:MAG TPA: hypothetical protein VNI01_10900 [Elusimicrobiota bacterium]|jgi:hypothetical protein|nr:hypothetical protein [Elusimicrobiota bacterium]
MRLSTGLWAALALGLALRVAYDVRARGLIPTSSDGYETIALSLVERGEYALEPGKPTSLREPGFPFLIAGAYALGGGRRPGLVLALQAAMGLAAALMVLALGRALFGEAEARLGFVCALFYPQAIYYGAYFFRETLMIFLFTLVAWRSCRWSARDGRRAALEGGLAAAALGLSNSATLPALGLAGIGLWLCAPRAERVRRTALYFAPIVLAVCAWTGRNAALHGRLILGSTHGGEEFYQALITPPEDLGTERQTAINAADPAFQEALHLPEAERNAFLFRAGARYIAAHPAVYLGRVAARVVKLWRLFPYPRRYDHAYWAIVLVSLASDGWMIPLGLWGAWRFRRRWRDAPALPAGIVGFTLVYGLLHAVIRYRMPLMPCVALLAAVEARRLIRRAA